LKSIFNKIYIASDHAGYEVKELVKKKLYKKNFLNYDLGPNNSSSVDYPDYAKKVGLAVKRSKSAAGILICGSGTGMSMTANRIRGIRAAVCYNTKSTRLSRLHNNANIISLGSRLTKKNIILKLVDIFLSTKFEGGRHLKRVKKI